MPRQQNLWVVFGANRLKAAYFFGGQLAFGFRVHCRVALAGRRDDGLVHVQRARAGATIARATGGQ